MQAGYRGGTHSPHSCLPGFGHQLEAAAAVALVNLCHPGKKICTYGQIPQAGRG